MQSPDDEPRSFGSPVSVNGSPKSTKSTSSDEGELVSSPALPLSPAPSNGGYSVLLGQRLEEVILEPDYVDVKARKDRISIDSEASGKSESSDDFPLAPHVEHKDRLEAVNIIIPPSVVLDAESSSSVTAQIVGDMSRSNASLGRQLEEREIKARQDALAMIELQEQCRTLTLQLQTLQQQRQAEIREAARIAEERRAAVARQKALQVQVERTGY
jgi:hypothetical protein